MVIKKYIAVTEQEALEMAREELGKDAVIMSVKNMEPRGIWKLFRKASVEVTAAVDEVQPQKEDKMEAPDFSKLQEIISQDIQPEPAADSRKMEQKNRTEELVRRKEILPPDEEKAEETEGKSRNESAAREIEQKLNNLQDLLEKQMNSRKVEEEAGEEEETDLIQSYTQLVRNQLLDSEVEAGYVDQILEEIDGTLKKDAALDNILASIYQKIVLKIGQPRLIDIHSQKTRYIFFIGPTGVGKTTTIAKIASTLKLSRKARVALITSDTYRIAAVEQLKTYANILGIPLKVIYSPDEMEKTKEELESYDLVLIDTAGRSHNNKEQREDIHKLLEMVPEEDREVYLVLSVTTKYRDLVKITQTYSQVTKYNLIFTKLDETDAIGNIYNIRMLTGAPLSYLTWGQNVPDDIGKIDAQRIAKQLLGGNG